MIRKIRSVTNSEIKEYTKLLKKSKARREAKLFLIEGARELNIAMPALGPSLGVAPSGR